MNLYNGARFARILGAESHLQAVYEIQPLHDPRWTDFVNRHPRSSVFHAIAWLKALCRTYGYEPIAYTTSPPDCRLENGLVFCRVTSCISGRRLVSLPFSDHCEPLVNDSADEAALFLESERMLDRDRLRYVEVRAKGPITLSDRPWFKSNSYTFHELDLRPDLNTLFANCHKSCTQRKIRRAERERLTYEAGRSPALFDEFWRLFLITRRRHCLMPQPISWFRNLIDCFGDALQIRVARKDQHPVAAILTLRHKDTLMYKYGCSDAAFNNLGGTHLLFWRSIE